MLKRRPLLFVEFQTHGLLTVCFGVAFHWQSVGEEENRIEQNALYCLYTVDNQPDWREGQINWTIEV